MEDAKDSVSEVNLLDMSNTSTAGHIVNLKPGVETSRHAVLEGHVNVVRSAPSISSDHRPLEATEELSIFSGQHAVGSVGELGDPHHLRIGLRVLSWIQHEIECLGSTDIAGNCGALTSHHGCLPLQSLQKKPCQRLRILRDSLKAHQRLR